MSPLLLLSCLALLNAAAARVPTCQEFANVTVDETQPLGIWHLVHFKNKYNNGTGHSHCLEFSAIDEEDQDILRDSSGKFVSNVDFSRISLKMIIPCQDLPQQRRKHYYLERLERAGSYRTILLPNAPVRNEERLSRYELRLKICREKYLCMMDCHERYVFVFSKTYPTGTSVDRQLAKMVEDYWA